MTPTLVVGSLAAPDARVEAGAVDAVGLEPQFGRTVWRSIVVASLVFFLGVGLPMWWFTGSVWDGIGLGAFTAFWGGPGFGLMAAGAIWAHRHERA